MKSELQYSVCQCGKEVRSDSFNKHLSTHYNPIGRNCIAWYKNYFKREDGVCVCKKCDEEVHSYESGLSAALLYEKHLAIHGITRSKLK